MATKTQAKENLGVIKSILDNGIFIPEINPTYHVSTEVTELFSLINKKKSSSTQKILLKGPHGAGKTEMAMHYASTNKLPILIMDCANLREARDWFGYKTIEDGKILWHESQFDKAISQGNTVILLDEINRVSPFVVNTLLPLLDGRGFTYLEEKGDIIKVGPNTVIFATMNEGAAYSGTNLSDLALLDRFNRLIEVDYLDKPTEVDVLTKRTKINAADAKKLVDIASEIRTKNKGLNCEYTRSISTRQLIAAAEDFVENGVGSLSFTVTNFFSSEGDSSSERAAVMQLIQGKFGKLK